jgi:hypothetical protein
MLLCQVFSCALRRWDNGHIQFVPREIIVHQIPEILLQILYSSLKTQQKDGGWGDGQAEVTSYVILTLNECLSISWTTPLLPSILSAISKAKTFLYAHFNRWDRQNKLWIEKVAYSSPVLSNTYCLSALRASPHQHKWNSLGPQKIDEAAAIKLSQFFGRVPLFSLLERDLMLQCAAVQSLPYLDYLRSHRLDIFPQKPDHEDKYLRYIPLTWTACNNLGSSMSLYIIQEMALLSMFNYQVDEYMESVVAPIFKAIPSAIRRLVDVVCGLSTPAASNGEAQDYHMPSPETNSNGNGHEFEPTYLDQIKPIKNVLSLYVQHFLEHPRVVRSPASIQKRLRHDLAEFLHAHITQISDNISMLTITESNKPHIRHDGTKSFLSWVRGTGAIHTSCPVSFTFYQCLISDEGDYPIKGSKQSYLAEDLRLHLAAMCRMYNDYGSEKRDQDECNLNCLDFPEFVASDVDAPNNSRLKNVPTASMNGNGKRDRSTSPTVLNAKRSRFRIDSKANEPNGHTNAEPVLHGTTMPVDRKKELLWIAEYERQCLKSSFEHLAASGLAPKYVKAFRLFIDVTDLYGQLYVARDIGVAVKTA